MTAMEEASLPLVAVAGGPLERGRAYGSQAAERIGRSIGLYEQVFRQHAGLDWAAAVARAERYLPAIEAYLPAALAEMQGIAEGAGVAFGDILALNARSELMFAAGGGDPGPGECTAFALLPEAGEGGRGLLGQNWDWLAFARDTMMLLAVRREEGPGYVTLVEAGLLAKAGLNAAGIGLCTNTLVSTRDGRAGEGGVPYHIVLRRLLDATSLDAALKAIYLPRRALSANYLLADARGLACNAETQPGGGEAVRLLLPEQGLLVHANHFLDPGFAREDLRVRQSPSSQLRNWVLRERLRRGGPVSLERAMQALSDDRNAPYGVSAYPDPVRRPLERYCTLASLVMDPAAGALYVAAGPPSRHPYRRYELQELLGAAPAPAAGGPQRGGLAATARLAQSSSVSSSSRQVSGAS